MINNKPQKHIYKIERVGHLKCYIEHSDLMWYEKVFINPSMRGQGYCKWLFRESILNFRGDIEVDVLGKRPQLTRVFRALHFKSNGLSQRYYNCRVWRFINTEYSRIRLERMKILHENPKLNNTIEWETSRFLWKLTSYYIP